MGTKIIDMKYLIEYEMKLNLPICKCGKEMKIESMMFCNCEVVVDCNGEFVSAFGRYSKPESIAFVCKCGEKMSYLRGDKE